MDDIDYLEYEKKCEETGLFDLYHISSILCHWSELVVAADDPKDRKRKLDELSYLITLCQPNLNRAMSYI